jgi:hypothetical protein
MSVFTTIDSAPGSATGIIRISRTWGCATWKSFLEKWPVAELPKKKVLRLMLFYAENFIFYIFFRSFWTPTSSYVLTFEFELIAKMLLIYKNKLFLQHNSKITCVSIKIKRISADFYRSNYYLHFSIEKKIC